MRNLKAQKVDKREVDAAVKVLLSLKEEFKAATGSDWKPGAAPPAEPAKKGAAPAKTASVGQASDLNEKINLQGEVVRNLKAQKADKGDIDAAVKILLGLKADYKAATGSDWKPGTTIPATPVPKAASFGQASDLNEKINQQGEIVRNLKAQKADKGDVDAAVKILLGLKAEYKTATGQDWKPGTVVAAPAPVKQNVGQVSDSNEKIVQQGEIVRNLKAQKAAKADIDAAVKILLELKAEYKKITGSDWKPSAAAAPAPAKQTTPSKPPAQTASSGQVSDLNEKIALQGETVRKLKAEKAAKLDVDAAVKILLDLKAEYKKASGQDWKPPTAAAPAQAKAAPQQSKAAPAPVKAQNKENMEPSNKEELTKKVNQQGDVVRQLKTDKAPKEAIDAAVAVLKQLKEDYKKATGEDFPVAGRQPQAAKPKEAPKEKKKPEPKKAAPTADDASGAKKQTRLGLEAKKEESLSDWYSQVITKGEMIDYYDVSGCYILRPWAFAVWKEIKKFFDAKITDMGVKECYFPMFVSKAALEKEKDHIADFAPEVAWVTKSGESDLAEPIAIRPTSETGMYPAYAKWIQSYRDLPIRLNQWNSVVVSFRAEFWIF